MLPAISRSCDISTHYWFSCLLHFHVVGDVAEQTAPEDEPEAVEEEESDNEQEEKGSDSSDDMEDESGTSSRDLWHTFLNNFLCEYVQTVQSMHEYHMFQKWLKIFSYLQTQLKFEKSGGKFKLQEYFLLWDPGHTEF